MGICPLNFGEGSTELAEFSPSLYDCAQDACAWWDKENQCCAILTLARGLNRAVYEEFGGRSQ